VPRDSERKWIEIQIEGVTLMGSVLRLQNTSKGEQKNASRNDDARQSDHSNCKADKFWWSLFSARSTPYLENVPYPQSFLPIRYGDVNRDL
jgi:hypothetical protein